MWVFRGPHGETHVNILEAITPVVLTVGYLRWAYPYLVGG